MKVKDVMHKSPILVSNSSKIREVWKLLFQKHYNSVIVVDANKKMLGIVTKKDLLSLLYPDYEEYIEDFTSASNFDDMEKVIKDIGNKLITSCMNKKVIFTREDTHAMRALSRMISRHVDQLPVLDNEDKVVGILTKSDIFYKLFKNSLLGKISSK